MTIGQKKETAFCFQQLRSKQNWPLHRTKHPEDTRERMHPDSVGGDEVQVLHFRALQR